MKTTYTNKRKQERGRWKKLGNDSQSLGTAVNTNDNTKINGSGTFIQKKGNKFEGTNPAYIKPCCSPLKEYWSSNPTMKGTF
jgi:hypothetical protein